MQRVRFLGPVRGASLHTLAFCLFGGCLLLPLGPAFWAAVKTHPTPLLTEGPRLAELLRTTFSLSLLSAAFALPFGTFLALALNRVPLVGATWLNGGLTWLLFLPLPIAAIAWQVILGYWLPPLQLAPGTVAWRPWNQGLLPAAWVHAMAAIPWVFWLVQAALQSTDRDVEELATLQGGFWNRFRFVIAPRLRLGLLAALLWLIVQTSTEIPITDAMMVRTFAEEVYTQFVSASQGLGQAMLVTLPLLLGTGTLAMLALRRLQRIDWPFGSEWMRPVLMPGPPRRWLNLICWGVAAVVVLSPLLALLWKAGGADQTRGFEISRLAFEIQKVTRTDGLIVLKSLGVAVAVGLVTTALGWGLVWFGRSSRIAQFWLMLLGVLLAITPGPILGFGLKELIQELISAEAAILQQIGWQPDFLPLRSLLYDQPSPLPGAWACTLRFLPLAMLLAACSIRTIPAELWELTALQGLSVWQRWRLILYPLTGGLAARCVLLVAALSLGEVSASKLVNPPFYSNAVLRLFDQMHYGADSTVAALALLQLAGAGLFAGLWLILALERLPTDTTTPQSLPPTEDAH